MISKANRSLSVNMKPLSNERRKKSTDVKENANSISRNDKNSQANRVRTRLLLFIDHEVNKYIKNSSIRINHELPKEIVKKYAHSHTVSFNNPTINSGSSNLDLSRKMLKASGHPRELKQSNSINISENQNKTSKAIGVYYYSKCLKEIGQEFIEHRKKNVSFKKFDKDGISGEKSKNLQIETELSFIETINNISSCNQRTSNKSSLKRISDCEIKSKNDELFINKKVLEARKVQHYFDKLQYLVSSIKNTEFEENLDNCYKITNSNFQNFNKNFNEELFEILKFKGLDFNSNILFNKNQTNQFSDIKNSPERNFFTASYFKVLEDDLYQNDTNNSFFNSKKLSEIPKNPFSMAKIDKDSKMKTTDFIDNRFSSFERNHFSKRGKYGFFDYNEIETSDNTGVNVSPIRIHKLTSGRDVSFDEVTEKFEESDYIAEDEKSVSRKLTSEYFFQNENSNSLFEDLKHRISKISFKQDKNFNLQNYGTTNLENKLVSLLKFNSLGKHDSEYSKISGSDLSKVSILSKNKSDITKSSITELSEDII